MFLEIVPHSRDISGDFHTVRKADAGDLADSRVRLLRSLGCYLDANAALEWRREEDRAVLDAVESARQGHGLRLPLETRAIGFRKLIDRWHRKLESR